MTDNYNTDRIASQLGGVSASPPRPSRPLERIGSEADRVQRMAYLVQEFLDRFHGSPPPMDTAGAANGPIQVSYHNELDRLTANLEVLDARIQALNEIG